MSFTNEATQTAPAAVARTCERFSKAKADANENARRIVKRAAPISAA